MGFELTDLTPRMRARYDVDDDTEGVLVASVARGSIADVAGLERGDVIRTVNRRRVRTVDEFYEAVDRLPSERSLALRVRRGSQTILVTLRRPS